MPSGLPRRTTPACDMVGGDRLEQGSSPREGIGWEDGWGRERGSWEEDDARWGRSVGVWGRVHMDGAFFMNRVRGSGRNAGTASSESAVENYL